MRLQTIIILIIALVSTAGAETVSVYTDPPAQEIWVNGAFAGISPITIDGNPGDEFDVTIPGFDDYRKIVVLETGDVNRVLAISTEPEVETKGGRFFSGFLIGFGIGFVSMVIVSFITYGDEW